MPRCEATEQWFYRRIFRTSNQQEGFKENIYKKALTLIIIKMHMEILAVGKKVWKYGTNRTHRRQKFQEKEVCLTCVNAEWNGGDK